MAGKNGSAYRSRIGTLLEDAYIHHYELILNQGGRSLNVLSARAILLGVSLISFFLFLQIF